MSVLEALGLEVNSERWRAIVEIAKDASQKGWWDSYGLEMGESQRLYADLEYGAASISEYQRSNIPGLFQTREYISALIEQDTSERRPERVYKPEHMIDSRIRRQQMLHRPDGPVYEAILDEAVIRRLRVLPAVMRAQLHHLAEEMEKHPKITLRVLSVDARMIGISLPRSNFHLFTYPDSGDPSLVVAGTASAEIVHDDPDKIAPYRRHYERIREVTLSEAESIALLRRTADRLVD